MTSATPIPVKALESNIAILGKTGSGKSNAAKVVAEVLMQQEARVCVLDPTGTWWGLRLWPDGKPSRFKPFIFGGQHADLPIAPEHGATIAEAIGTSSDSSIIDTRLLSVGGRTKFFTSFAETLLRTNNGPLHLIIDEAHLFAPQTKVNDVASGAMVHAANNLVSLGRGLGLRIVLISQRPAKLHKDSLTQVETLVAMRLIAPQDRRAIDDWIGEWAEPAAGRELVAGLSSLPTGDAWIWAPEIGVLKREHFPLAATFDSGSVRPGDRVELVPIDAAAIGERLMSIRSEVIANDPKALKRRVAELEAQAQRAGADPAAVQAARDAGYQDGYQRGSAEEWQRGSSAVRAELQALAGESERVAADAQAVHRRTKALLEAIAQISRVAPKAPPPAASRKLPAPASSSPPAVAFAADADLTPAKQRILIALRELEAVGQEKPEKTAVAWFAGASPASSTFANNLGALRTAGFIEYPGPGQVRLSEKGAAEVPARPAPTHDALMTLVAERMTPALVRMLTAVAARWPDAISIGDLAGAVEASASSSTFSNNRGRLRSLGLVDYPGSGLVRAADLLFPGGVR